MSGPQPIAEQYQQALLQLAALGPAAPASLSRRVAELVALLEFVLALEAPGPLEERLDAALLIMLGQLRSGRGLIATRSADGRSFRLRARGAASCPESVAAVDDEALSALGIQRFVAIGQPPSAVLGVGARLDGSAYAAEDDAFLDAFAACAASPLENARSRVELERLNRTLSAKVFQLHSLFDISRELTSLGDESEIRAVTARTLMGQLMVTRCAMFERTGPGLALVHARGVAGADSGVVDDPAALAALAGPMAVAELPAGPLRERLAAARLALVVPFGNAGHVEGVLALGARVVGPFGEEEREFVSTLAGQAQAALDNARLQRVRLQKLRQDRELQIAREIQQSLFPRRFPVIPGFDVAALSQPSREVGGDTYDVNGLADGRVVLSVADVSGKGTPASLLMASAHAALRLSAGSAPPAAMLTRINSFLYEHTQANRYLTLFYAELSPAERRLVWVDAGHVPPYLVRADGRVERLTEGGPVIGLLADVAFDVGETTLGPGDRLLAVTDGVTEALDAGEREFGDERALEVLLGTRGMSAEATLRTLVDAVHAWTGPAGPGDDLTALVLLAL